MAEKKIMITLRMPAELVERMDQWRAKQVVAPQRSAFINQAVERMLQQVEKDSPKSEAKSRGKA